MTLNTQYLISFRVYVSIMLYSWEHVGSGSPSYSVIQLGVSGFMLYSRTLNKGDMMRLITEKQFAQVEKLLCDIPREVFGEKAARRAAVKLAKLLKLLHHVDRKLYLRTFNYAWRKSVVNPVMHEDVR